MTIGGNIKAARKKAGLTQKQLGDLCGMADSAIRRYESGRGNPTTKTLTRIAEALGVSIVELCGFEQEVKDGKSVLRVTDNTDFSAFASVIKAAHEDEERENAAAEDESTPPETQHTGPETKLLSAFSQLNEEGQQKAVERVEELTEIPKYQK